MNPDNNGLNRNENGTFAKGNPGKPKGAVTKVSTKVKESIVNFLEANVEKIQQDFDALKPRERLQFISEILPYAAPKLSAVQVDSQSQVFQDITITWTKPDELPSFSNESNMGNQEGS